MKAVWLMLASLAWLAAPACADETYQSTMSGSVTIKVTPDSASTTSEGDHTLTINFVKPKKQDEATGKQHDLDRCGNAWNKKFAALKKKEQKATSRAVYRSCIYECLGQADVAPPCPPELKTTDEARR